MELRIAAARAALGDRLVILGHHYQRDEVIRFADYTGDSFKLAARSPSIPQADYIVFCGVHFMAESADILALPHQQVILPDLAAGCSMADMVAPDQLETCWASSSRWASRRQDRAGHLHQLRPRRSSRSSASAAARLHLVERGGHAEVGLGATREDPVPARSAPRPQHGVEDGRAARRDGGVGSVRAVRRPDERRARSRARLILWKGHCSVHVRFTAKQIEAVRQQHPGVRVIVHPEVPFDVLQAADDSGSTEYILKTVRRRRAGTTWAVGTEIHLVHRLAEEVAPDKTVLSLDQFGCLCSTMFRVSPNHLLWVLEGLLDGEVTTGSSCRMSRRNGLRSLWIGCFHHVDRQVHPHDGSNELSHEPSRLRPMARHSLRAR